MFDVDVREERSEKTWTSDRRCCGVLGPNAVVLATRPSRLMVPLLREADVVGAAK